MVTVESGTKLGIRETRAMRLRLAAEQFAAIVPPIIASLLRAGSITTYRGIASALNGQGVSTARGGKWHVLARAQPTGLIIGTIGKHEVVIALRLIGHSGRGAVWAIGFRR